jgi:hypothetical protein
MTEITWCKLHHDFADDAKFLRVSEITGAKVELVQACFARALCRASSDANRGSTAGIDLDEFAWWFKQPLGLIRSIFDCFEHVSRMIKEGRLANWAKRQGAAAEKLAKTVSAGAERQRRYRRRKAENVRQGEFAFAGNSASHEATEEHVAGVTSGVTQGVTSPADTETDYSASKRDAESREPPPAEVVQIIDYQERGHGRRSGKRRSRSTELAPDWRPGDDDWRFAAARGYDADWIDRQAELFRAHYRAKGAVVADWHECWKAWVLRSVDFGASNCGGRSGGSGGGRVSWVAAARQVLAKGTAAAASGSYADI